MEPLFSVIIVHFNQPNYWKNAIESVLIQTYPNIQLIFADDGSANFSKEEVKNFIVQNSHSNLTSYKLLQNTHNLGTVKNINHALSEANGDYVSIIAADDALYDEQVLYCYSKKLKTCTPACGGIFALSLDCSEDLEDTGQYYIGPADALAFGSLSSREQFKKLAYRCCIHLGAMAFTNEMLQKYAPFDECYKLIEDWPFLLRVTRNGGHLEYADFKALKYRAGGISRPLKTRSKDITQSICKDHLELHDKEILPYTKYFSFFQLKSLLKKYDEDRGWMKKEVCNFGSIKRINIVKKDPRFLFLLWGKLETYQKRIIGGMLASIFSASLLYCFDVNGLSSVFCILFALMYLGFMCLYVLTPTLHEAYIFLKKYLFNPYE